MELPKPYIRFTHFPATIVAMVQSKGYETMVLEKEGGIYHVHVPETKAFVEIV